MTEFRPTPLPRRLSVVLEGSPINDRDVIGLMKVEAKKAGVQTFTTPKLGDSGWTVSDGHWTPYSVYESLGLADGPGGVR